MRSRSLSRPPLTPAVRAALTAAHVDGTRVRLAEQLPADDYREVAAVLAALGGLWSPAQHATLFPDGSDPDVLIRATLEAGVALLHPRTTDGWVRTPDELAGDLVGYPHSDLAWLPAGAQVLEPSAGIGSLVAAMLRANPHLTVTAVEPDPARSGVCAGLGHQVSVRTQTFESFGARAMAQGLRYEAIVMNPPFTLSPGLLRLFPTHLRENAQLSGLMIAR
jgi:hypothetical protein